jgi:hypothetical protein
MFTSNLNPETTLETLKGRVWTGVFIYTLWLIFFLMASLTFPFVGNKTQGDNLIYGFIAGIPFLVPMTIYMVLAVKDLKRFKSENKGGCL